MKLTKDGVTIIGSVEIADSFWSRMSGLMGKAPLAPGSALYIPHCGSIHTFLMRFNLDLVFVGREWQVVRIVRNVAPYRIVLGGLSAVGVVEMTAGWLPKEALRAGDHVSL